MKTISRIYCRSYQKVYKWLMPLLPYRYPKILNINAEVADVLQEKKIDSVLLVTDKVIRSLGITKSLEDSLEAANIKVNVYDETVPNPTVNNVEAARAIYLDNDCKSIIAIGGGSAMDCAKATGARIARKHKTLEQLRGQLKVRRKTPLFFAIPTTAGTGSECTLAAVITNPKKGEKYAINDFVLIPDYAVLDYNNILKLPPRFTAYTGLDALVHAVEAYIGTGSTKETRRLSIEAVSLINKYLVRSYEDGSDIEARKNMLQAAYLAGASFTRSYVGYIHALSHALTAKYGIPHGLANATLLPILLNEYGNSIIEKLATLARKSGVVKYDYNDSETATYFIMWVRSLNAHMDIPSGFNQIIDCDIPFLAKHADREANPLYPVPKLYDVSELEYLYRRIKALEIKETCSLMAKH